MGKTRPGGRALDWGEGMNGGRSACGTVARRLSRGMRAERLPVEALTGGPEAANRARVRVKRPDRGAQDGEGRSRRRQAEALIGRISHLS